MSLIQAYKQMIKMKKIINLKLIILRTQMIAKKEAISLNKLQVKLWHTEEFYI
jgi:hypothetical protein